MPHKAVLFDLDGTLLDTLEDLADSTNAVLKRLDFPSHPVEAYKFLVGGGAESLVSRALPQGQRHDKMVERGVEELGIQYGRRWADKTHAYAGVADLLDGVTERRIPMAVLSNKPDAFTKMIVARFLGRWKFGAVLGARPGVPHKPDPASALEVARLLGTAPADFLYLGDTNTDVWTALAAGMHPVGALWGFRSAEELTAAGAEMLVEHPLDVLSLL